MRPRYQKTNRAPKRRRPSVFKKVILPTALAVFLAGGLAYFLFFSPVLKIKEISVQSQNVLPAEDLITIAQNQLRQKQWSLLTKNTVFLADKNGIAEQILKTYPQIKNARVTVSLFTLKLTIKVESRQAAVLWCYSNTDQCFLIDEEGVLFQSVIKDSYLQQLPLILVKAVDKPQELGETVYSKEDMAKIIVLSQGLAKDLKLPVEHIALDQTRFVIIKLKEGWEAYFTLDEEPNLSLDKLRTVLVQELPKEKRTTLQYIDLRFSKIYYK